MALTVLHQDVQDRMLEMFTSVEREAYANGFDLRHYRQDTLKKHILETFKIHPLAEDECMDKIFNNAWIFNYILQKVNDGINVPHVFQRYSSMYAEEMYDIWFRNFLNETYV